MCDPLLAQVSVNQAPSTSTGSVKVTRIVASRGASTPFARGSVVEHVRTELDDGRRAARDRRAGATKSFALLSCRRSPPLMRKSDVVLLPAGVVVDPSRQSALP